MKKIIVAPDSFKGSLSAKQVADIISVEIMASNPGCAVVKMPIADGGEGSVEAIIAATGGRIEEASVLSPDGRKITAGFGITTNGQAVIEMAQSSGITRQIGLHPMTSSTYGFGQLILSALESGPESGLGLEQGLWPWPRLEPGPELEPELESGPRLGLGLGPEPEPESGPDLGPGLGPESGPILRLRDFFLCIGGSATTDGGCGMAAALGVKFLDSRGDCFVPCGATLERVSRIDMSGIDKRVLASDFTVMCDVDNPLYGPSGAAYIYAPQKGADPAQVQALDRGLRHLGDVFAQTFGSDYANIPGAGAAGGLGFGCMAMLNARLESGIDAILDLCEFDKHLAGSDLIITGEGRLDAQSFSGKVLSGILRRAGDVPVVSICGACDAEESLLNLLREHGLTFFEASKGISVEESLRNPEKYLKRAATEVMVSSAQGINL